MEEKTGWRGQNESQIDGENRMWQTCWCCRDQEKACRIAQVSAEKLEHTGPVEKSGLSATERAVDEYTRAAFCLNFKGKGTEQSVQNTRLYGGRESSKRESHLGVNEENQNKSLRRKGWTLP